MAVSTAEFDVVQTVLSEFFEVQKVGDFFFYTQSAFPLLLTGVTLYSPEQTCTGSLTGLSERSLN